MRPWGIVAILAFLSACNGPSPPPESPTAPSHASDAEPKCTIQEGPTGAEGALQRLFRQHVGQAALDALRAEMVDDPAIASLLQRVRLDVRSAKPVPEAAAYRAGTAPCIRVDVGFLVRDRFYLDLAGYEAAANVLDAELRTVAMDKVTPRDQDATESLRFDREIIPSQWREAHRWLRWTIAFDTVVWATLHEVAHHALGHLRAPRPSATLQQSRDFELAADAWAFSQMLRLGYPLCYVAQYFSSRSIAEQRWLALALVEPESQSTHPLFATRLDRLNQTRGVAAQGPTRFWRSLNVVLGPRRVATFHIDTREPEGQPFLVSPAGLDPPLMLAGMRHGHELHLVQRDREGRIAMVVPAAPMSCSVPVAIRTYDPNGVLEKTVTLPAWQTTFRTFESLTLPGNVALRDVMLFSQQVAYGGKLVRDALLRQGRPQPTADRGANMVAQLLRGMASAHYDYASGALDDQAYNQATLRLIGGVLGPAMNDPALASAMAELENDPVLGSFARAGEGTSSERARKSIRLVLPELDAALQESSP